MEVVPHWPRLPRAETVVQALVIGVVEALLQHDPFEVPVDLGHEAEAWSLRAYALDRLRPERRRRKTPGSLEDFGQHEHGHVAADAVTLAGDLLQLSHHRVLGGGIAVVQLERIRPTGKVRIPAVGQESIAPRSPDPGIVFWRSGKAQFGSWKVILGLVLDPPRSQR